MNKFLTLFLALSLVSFGQQEAEQKDKKEKKTNVLTDAGDVAKMVIAKQKMYAADFVGALNTFREIEKNSPKDPAVLHYIGYCYYNLKQNEKAKDYLLRSIEADPNAKPENHLVLGKIVNFLWPFCFLLFASSNAK